MHDDTLEFCRGADREVPKKVTQRAVLSFVASVFNSIGSPCALYDENAHAFEGNLGSKVENSGTTKLIERTKRTS